MSEKTQEPGALQRVVNDPVSRRRFMGLAGAGGAASLSVLLAACGSDSGTTTESTTAATPSQSGTGSSARATWASSTTP